MKKKILLMGLSAAVFFTACQKERDQVDPSNHKTARTTQTTNVGIQNAAYYHDPALAVSPSGNNSIVDVVPNCLAGQCAIYSTYKVFIRKIVTGVSTPIEGPYNVQVVARPSINQPPNVMIDVLRANVPDYEINVVFVGGTPIVVPAPRTGLYSVCLMPPGIQATIDPNDPNLPQWWNLYYGTDNI